MLRHSLWSLPLALLAAAVFFVCADDVDAQVKKPTQKFTAPKSTQLKILRVQARAPQWRAVTIAPNRAAAKNIKRTLVRQGWQVQTRANRAGQVAIRARNVHWYTRAVVNNRPTAQYLVSILHAQGFHARIR